MCQVTIAQLMQGQLDKMEAESIVARNDARANHKIEASAFTQNQLAFCQGKLAAIRQLRNEMPRSWRKLYVDDQ